MTRSPGWKCNCLAMTLLAVLLACVAPSWAETGNKGSQPMSSREMFRDLGVSDRYFKRLIDGRALTSGENETLWRVLLRLRLFPLEDIEHWAMDDVALERAIQQPDGARGSIFQLRGRVLEVEPIKPPSEAAAMFELPTYYRCRIELDAPPGVADVFTEHVPKEWRNGAKPNVQGGAFGVFLKIGEKVGDASPLIFATRRVAFYPDNLLGRLGMDFGLFGSVQDGKSMSPSDREAFFQLLAAASRSKPDELIQAAEEALPDVPKDWQRTDADGKLFYSVTPLFNEPATQRGRLVDLKGIARRVEKIVVDDADLIARFGIREYYQISLFTDDSQSYPVTFCVRELPDGMPYGNSPRYGETVRIAGFFFKTWSYAVPKVTDSAAPPQSPKTHRQYSPLLIGRSLTWYRTPGVTDYMPSGIVIGSICVAAMLLIWLFAWFNQRREKKWLERMESSPASGGAPDFSRLAEMDQGAEGHGDIGPAVEDRNSGVADMTSKSGDSDTTGELDEKGIA